MTAMRIVYFSDVHLEIRESQAGGVWWSNILPLGFGPELSSFVGAVDLLILAGDIGRVRSTRNVSPLAYARQAADFLGCAAVLVPGNHEYYRGCFREDREALLGAGDRAVTVLDRGEALIARHGAPLRVLGATLWTDYAVVGDPAAAMNAAEREIFDHRLIRASQGSGCFSPVDALAEHKLSRAWLRRKLAEPAVGPTLVVTHHVPHSVARHPGHGLNALAPAFCSDCDDLLEAASTANVAAWIFGHHHWSLAMQTRGVRLLSAQLGYPGEHTGWTGPGFIEI
jgi:hypothetical protein